VPANNESYGSAKKLADFLRKMQRALFCKKPPSAPPAKNSMLMANFSAALREFAAVVACDGLGAGFPHSTKLHFQSDQAFAVEIFKTIRQSQCMTISTHASAAGSHFALCGGSSQEKPGDDCGR
jgi:hypothetical protein